MKQLPWLILSILLVGGIMIWLVFVGEQKTHLELSFRSQVERLSDDLLRARLEGRLDAEVLPFEVRTFALYTPQGELAESWGSPAPRRIEVSRPWRRSVSHLTQRDQEWIDFVRPLQPLRPRMNYLANPDLDDMPPPFDGHGPPGVPPFEIRPRARTIQGFVFMTISAASVRGRLMAWSIGTVVGAVAWTSFVVFVGFLWFRTRKYQAALNQHRELLQFAEASRTLSHELQNPLAAILLQTALLKRSSDGSPANEVLVIEEEAQRMSALVTRVRDFLKDPRGQVERVDLLETVGTLVSRFASPIIVTPGSSGSYQVVFDPHRLRSVIENLLKNAVESGTQSSPEVLLSKPRTGWIRLEVLDRGTGFSTEALKNARQPFYTTKTTGTGIGLSIAGSFVEAAGGRLRLENRPDGGARVILELPDAEQGSIR